MAKIVKKWGDHSGDAFTVAYNPQGGEATFSSAPNEGMERESIVEVKGTEESIGIYVTQGSSAAKWQSHAKLMRGNVKGINIKCGIFLDEKGTPCTVIINRI
jgi:hypothetical protein